MIRLSPLTYPEVTGNTLCLDDTALESGLRFAAERQYSAMVFDDWPNAGRASVGAGRIGSRACLQIPSVAGASESNPVYRVIDVVARSLGRETSGAARVHLYQVGPESSQVVGLERPDPSGG